MFGECERLTRITTAAASRIKTTLNRYFIYYFSMYKKLHNNAKVYATDDE